MAGRQARHAPFAHDARGHARADGPQRVGGLVGELHLLAVIEKGARILFNLRVQRIGDFVAALLRE